MSRLRNWLKALRRPGRATAPGDPLQARERRVHSQAGQDGVLEAIFEIIGTLNVPPFYVEFGFNAEQLVGGTGANVAHLALNRGWHGLLLDRVHANPAINLHPVVLTSRNICEVFEAHRVPTEPDLVSIDVDSCDLWLWRALLGGGYRPRCVTVEYNCNIPLDLALTCPDDPSEGWEGDRVYGASLKALWLVGQAFGYSLVHVVHRFDAVFVRDDLIRVPLEVPAFATWRGATAIPTHPRCVSGRQAIMLDYEVFMETADVAAAQLAARGAALQYL